MIELLKINFAKPLLSAGRFISTEKYKNIKELILNTIEDLCSYFLYYDRKEDEDLSYEQLKCAVLSGEITID